MRQPQIARPVAILLCFVRWLFSPWVQVRASGLVVNSMGWIVELGYELLRHTLQARPPVWLSFA
jgi:hypothetical protein